MKNLQNNFLEARYFFSQLAMLLLLIPAATVASDKDSANNDNQPLKHIEISGISIATPAGKIADILIAQGYAQVNNTLFTKQEQLQNNRKTIFRVEIEDTAAFRQISYHRSLSGGRVKTAGDKQPIPAFENDTAQQLYQLICENTSEETKKTRACETVTTSSINAGHGQFIELDNHFSAQLSATAANTAMGIKYTY
ncbi:hypothetical protein SAMN05216302_101767 [Nitrosomonas aestuarii]|uniref:Uncharacterized protein n=1 Tax=Nitrosomonas aestuarii TaxID=52441 RepID=A0A1I4CUR5_9PROT|nr:hypothetical protein [Nitrosomonas aestuarii]SFK85028.1 hypothetical protein SAMN05216302_101767 [Nitrosomonas aestuarii]